MKKKKIKYEIDSLIDSDELRRLSERKIWNIISKIAMNENTPGEVLEDLSKDPRPSISWRVAGNKNTPPNTLDFLSNSEHLMARIAVAENPNTSIATLSRMMNDPNIGIQAQYAAEKNFNSRDILEDLLK